MPPEHDASLENGAGATAGTVERWRAPDGTTLTLRPIRPQDIRREAEFLGALSKESLYQRVFSSRGLLPGELKRLTRPDLTHEAAFVATAPASPSERIIGVARYVKTDDGIGCEFALIVADDWRRCGIGERLLNVLMDHARRAGLRSMIGYTLAANDAMRGLARKLGFSLRRDPDDATLTVLTKALT